MKKTGMTLLTLLLSIVCAVGVSAITYTASPARAEIDRYDEAYMAIYDAIAAGEDRIRLTEYSLHPEEVLQIYGDILMAAPEFFYMDNRLPYYYRRRGGKEWVTEVRLVYKLEEDERAEAILSYEQELSYIVSQVDVTLDDMEKALWVHDYLIASFAYDDTHTNFDAYSLFRDRKGVCQAYSLAYIAVLRELGVEAVMVASDEMNHAWNLVKVDDAWYHVDLVYDDPMPERMGRVLHEYFLLDDAAIRAARDPHTGWESTLLCSSSTYTDAVWKEIDSRMLYMEEQWYYIEPETMTLVVSEVDGSHRSEVFAFDTKWMLENDDSRYWVGVFSGVSEMLGYLFFNTPTEVLLYSPQTGSVSVYLESEPGQRFFGAQIYKNALEYRVAVEPHDPAGVTVVRPITDFNPSETLALFPFTDVSRLDRCYAAVRYVYNAGLFQGVSATKFAPNAPLTRAMFVTVLGRLCGVETTVYPTSGFSDVADGQWYTPYVAWAAEMGLVDGVGENRFNPVGEITREQMCKIVAGLGRQRGVGLAESTDLLLLYEDRASIAEWATAGVTYCAANGLIENRGLFAPANAASRADAAEIVAGFARLCGIV